MNDYEIWKPIGDLPYEASNLGRIRRSPLQRVTNCTIDGVIKQKLDRRTGYYLISVSIKGKVFSRRVHSLVAMAFHGPRPSINHTVAHFDGSRLNNCPSNLRWATRKENEADKARHGTRLCGEAVSGAKLSAEKVQQIRRSGESIYRLAPLYGVHPATIARIRRKATWRHVS